MKKKYAIAVSAATLLAPLFAFAQTTLATYLAGIKTNVINPLVGFSYVIVGAVFIYGAVLFALGGGDEKKREKGRNLMIYSLVAAVLIASLWGLLTDLNNVFGVSGGVPPTPFQFEIRAGKSQLFIARRTGVIDLNNACYCVGANIQNSFRKCYNHHQRSCNVFSNHRRRLFYVGRFCDGIKRRQ